MRRARSRALGHERRRAARQAGAPQRTARTTGRTALITGATSRLGAAAALGLAASGHYGKLLLAGRSAQRAEALLERLRDLGVLASFLEVDLAVDEEVRQMCDALRGGGPLHCVLCAAGVTALPSRREAKNGCEYHFALNFLSRFQTVNSLIGNLAAGGTAEDPSRVLLVGSSRHRGIPFLGFSSLGPSLPLALGDMDDLQLARRGAYGPWKAFGQAALCNVLFAYELQRRLLSSGTDSVAVSCIDPGPLTTAWPLYRKEENRMLVSDMPPWLQNLLIYFTRIVDTPEAAAESLVLLATSDLGALPCRTPRLGPVGYWERDLSVPSKFPLPWSWGTSYDSSTWRRLWDYAAGLASIEDRSPTQV